MIIFGANFSIIGIPETGLSPTITVRDTSDGSIMVNEATMPEVGGGAYKYYFSNDTTKEYSAVIDGGIDILDSRYMTAWSERAKSEAEIIDILADTNELQGDWEDGGRLDTLLNNVPTNPLLTTDTRLDNLDTTISSRSNHTDPTSNIKGVENKDLTQVFNNEKGTDNAYTGTPPTVEEIRAELEATGTKLTNIKNQTDKLNFTGLDINATLDGEEVTTDSASREASKATGFSTHSAEQVWTTTNRELSTPDDYKADVSALADIAIDIKRMLGLSQENYKLFNPVYDSDKNLLSVTTKIYPTADDCNNDSNAIAEYAMTATYVEKQLDTYKVIRT